MPNGESILGTIILNSKTMNLNSKRQIQKPNGESKLKNDESKSQTVNLN